jgi:hypothetical protein
MDSRLTLAQAGRDDPRGLTGMQQVGRRRLHVRAVEMSDLGVIAGEVPESTAKATVDGPEPQPGSAGAAVT